MGQKKINLDDVSKKLPLEMENFDRAIYTAEEMMWLLKEGIRQALEIAASKATAYVSYKGNGVDKESITNVINLIE